MRTPSLLDQLLVEINQSVNTLHAKAPTTGRPNPSDPVIENEMSREEQAKSARLMRINHAGEIAAQGLYRGQALTAKDKAVKEQMEQSAQEENDHLNWCEQRLMELHSHKSYLNPVWYSGSFAIGAAAGAIGDKWSLGFVKETEDQVVRHLESHITQLPASDLRSMAIIQKMKEDEAHHGDVAMKAGGAKLPFPIRKVVMPIMSKVMTSLSAKI